MLKSYVEKKIRDREKKLFFGPDWCFINEKFIQSESKINLLNLFTRTFIPENKEETKVDFFLYSQMSSSLSENSPFRPSRFDINRVEKRIIDLFSSCFDIFILTENEDDNTIKQNDVPLYIAVPFEHGLGYLLEKKCYSTKNTKNIKLYCNGKRENFVLNISDTLNEKIGREMWSQFLGTKDDKALAFGLEKKYWDLRDKEISVSSTPDIFERLIAWTINQNWNIDLTITSKGPNTLVYSYRFSISREHLHRLPPNADQLCMLLIGPMIHFIIRKTLVVLHGINLIVIISGNFHMDRRNSLLFNYFSSCNVLTEQLGKITSMTPEKKTWLKTNWFPISWQCGGHPTHHIIDNVQMIEVEDDWFGCVFGKIHSTAIMGANIMPSADIATGCGIFPSDHAIIGVSILPKIYNGLSCD